MADEPDLQKYQSGEWVQYLQQCLQYAGYWSGDADGEFGDDLEQAVMQYQSAAGLTADGVVRTDTWAALTGASGGGDQSGGQQSEDPNERVLDVDWASEFPELYALATASDFDDYTRNVVGVDPELLKSDSDEPVA